MKSLAGVNILIAEDEFIVANDIALYFITLGANILGPAPTLERAQQLAERADAAILDMDLNGEPLFRLADRLVERGVPFVFFSEHDRNIIPPRLDHVASLLKPIGWNRLYAALFPAEYHEPGPSDVRSLLPKLRLAARLMLREENAADRLVEATLKLAIEQIDSRPSDASLQEWLNLLLRKTARSGHVLLN